MRGVAVYWHHVQFLSVRRTVEAVRDRYGVTIREGTLLTWVQAAATAVTPRVAPIADLVTTRQQMGNGHPGWWAVALVACGKYAVVDPSGVACQTGPSGHDRARDLVRAFIALRAIFDGALLPVASGLE